MNTSNWLNILTNFNLSSTANTAGKSKCDNAHLTIKNSSSDIKNHYYLYYKLPQLKIARHLENIYSAEEDVMKFVTLSKQCLECKKIIKTIRRKEEFVFITNKMLNDSTLHITRRPNARFNKEVTEYGICVKCYGYFFKILYEIIFANV